MKKLLAFAGIAAMLIACTDDPTEKKEDATESFKVTIESPTKAELTSTESAVWSENDEFSVFNRTDANAKWCLTETTGSEGTIKPVEEITDGFQIENVVSVYPYSETTALDGNSLKISVPSTQTLAEGTFDPKANFMLATTSGTELNFKNLVGYVKISLSTPAKKLTITGNNDEVLAGVAKVNTTTLKASLPVNGSKILTVDCSAAKTATYYIPVIPQTFINGLTVTIEYASGESEERYVKDVVAINRNEIYAIGEEQLSNDKGSFEFIFSKITATTVSFTVVPSDLEMKYILFIDYAENMEGLTTDEAIIEADAEYIAMLAEYYEMTLDEVYEALCGTGVYEEEDDSFDPGTEYTIWAYGVDDEHNAITSVFRENFTTLELETVDMSFDISASVDGTTISATVVPSRNDQMYYFDCLDQETLEYFEYDYEYVINYIVSYNIELGTEYYDMTAEEVVELICSVGPDSYDFEDCDGETTYDIFAAAISSEGVVISDVSKTSATTEKVEPSDNVITITVNNVTSTEIYISTTTTNDDPYAIVLMENAELAGMNDEEIVNTIVETYGPYLSWVVVNGNLDNDVASELDPDTEYLIAAFGYSGGTVTTALSKAVAKTLAEGATASSVKTGSTKGFVKKDAEIFGKGKVNLQNAEKPQKAASNSFATRKTIWK